MSTTEARITSWQCRWARHATAFLGLTFATWVAAQPNEAEAAPAAAAAASKTAPNPNAAAIEVARSELKVVATLLADPNITQQERQALTKRKNDLESRLAALQH